MGQIFIITRAPILIFHTMCFSQNLWAVSVTYAHIKTQTAWLATSFIPNPFTSKFPPHVHYVFLNLFPDSIFDPSPAFSPIDFLTVLKEKEGNILSNYFLSKLRTAEVSHKSNSERERERESSSSFLIWFCFKALLYSFEHKSTSERERGGGRESHTFIFYLILFQALLYGFQHKPT